MWLGKDLVSSQEELNIAEKSLDNKLTSLKVVLQVSIY
jgi:hypothetical protein